MVRIRFVAIYIYIYIHIITYEQDFGFWYNRFVEFYRIRYNKFLLCDV